MWGRQKTRDDDKTRGHGLFASFLNQSAIQQLDDKYCQQQKQLAQELSEAVSRWWITQPQESYGEKLALTYALSLLCDRYGMTVQCPRTKRPAKLTSQTVKPGTSRFRFKCYDESEHRRTTGTPDTIEKITLLPQVEHREGHRSSVVER